MNIPQFVLFGLLALACPRSLHAQTDTDNDGLPDGVETNTGTYVDSANTGTSPLLSDTDGDGVGDWYEVVACYTNPTVATSLPIIPYPLPDPDASAGVSNKPVKVYIMSGSANMAGIGYVNGTAPGTLEAIAKRENKFPNLVTAGNAWTTRNDVIYKGVITATAAGPLTVGQGSSSTTLGPELGFGQVMGYHHDEPVLLIKASQSNRSLFWDILPPGSPSFDYTDGYTYAGYGQAPNNWLTSGGAPTPYFYYAGKQYDDFFLAENGMGCTTSWASGRSYAAGIYIRYNGVTYTCKAAHTSSAASEPGLGAQTAIYWNVYSVFNVTDVLDNFATQYPQWATQGFEIAGYVWIQGYNDIGSTLAASRYEINLAQLIKSLRSYYANRYPGKCSTTTPFVLATGCGDPGTGGNGLVVANAQLAVSGELGNYSEFAGNVKTMDTRGYWRSTAESPGTQGFYYNNNAETYMLTGDALGRAMVELQQIGQTSSSLTVEQPAGINLTDGIGSVAAGTANVGSAATPLTFVIRNTGTTNITGLEVIKSGSHAADFTVGAPAITMLVPGNATAFTVTFTPSVAGTRTAALKIATNYTGGNPFDIALTGTGVAVPEIAVEQPAGTNLSNNAATLAFDTVNLGSSSSTLTFTIRNTGSAHLNGLAISKNGAHPSDFTTVEPGTTSLAPGTTATFNVTFSPTAAGNRSASIRIASNDADENPFIIALTGTGIAPEPTARITGELTGKEGGVLHLNASESVGRDGTSEDLTYGWDFDDDGQFDDAVGPQPVMALPDGPQSLPVRLRVTDADGLHAMTSATVTVLNEPPLVTLMAPPTAETGVPILVRLAVTDPSKADLEAGVTVTVDFGDGSSGVTISCNHIPQTISHTYALTGSRTISATAVDRNGSSSQAVVAKVSVLDQVSPASTSPDWSAFGSREASMFGERACGAGDLNGDGYADIVVAASNHNVGEGAQGKVTVYYGGPRGPDPSKSWSYIGEAAGWQLGSGVAPAGDVNGDGYSDLLIGVRGAETLDAQGELVSRPGAAYLFYGGAQGLGSEPSWTYKTSPDAGTGEDGSGIGMNVHSAGDINGDGHSDILIAGPNYGIIRHVYQGPRGPEVYYSQEYRGVVHLFLGSKEGVVGPVWSQIGQPGESLGGRQSIASGDLNGDGCSDVVLGGAPELWQTETMAGRIQIFYGSRAGLSNTRNLEMSRGVVGEGYGASVASAGDVNSDGYEDLAIGAFRYSNGISEQGAVFVHLGNRDGIAVSPAWTKEGGQAGGWFGSSVAKAGDANGDGYDDLLAAAGKFDAGETDEGKAYLFLGDQAGLRSSSSWSFETNQTPPPWNNMTWLDCVAGAGDVNGDGRSDIVVGTRGYTSSIQKAGAAWLFYGSPQRKNSSLVTFSKKSTPTANIDPISAATSVGDVNGDGLGDVVLAAPGTESLDVVLGTAAGQIGGAETTPPNWKISAPNGTRKFGHAICPLGDINNDGYDDFAVGAPGDPGSAGIPVVPGRVVVYCGSASGMTIAKTLHAEDAISEFGYALAVNDADGDGDMELLVGAPGFQGSGKVYLYQHDNGFFADTPSWSNAVSLWNQIFLLSESSWGRGSQPSRYGESLCALDWNRDGLGDFAIGCSNSDNRDGRYYIRLGGLRPSVQLFWFQPGRDQSGYSLATGDLYGSGFDAITIGMPTSDGSDSGRIRVFTPDTAVAKDLSPSQSGDAFGHALTVFDYDRDGTHDVISSAPYFDVPGNADVGVVKMFPGSLTQLGVPTWESRGYASAMRLGTFLDHGDVDADGLPDLIAVRGDGRADAIAYPGMLGRVHMPHLRRHSPDGSDIGPYSTDGTVADPESGLLLKAFAPPIPGRSLARLEWQLAVGKESYDGSQIQTGDWHDTGLVGCTLAEKIGSLESGKNYRLRLRVAYHAHGTEIENRRLPVAPEWRTKWMSPGGGDASKCHIRTKFGTSTPNIDGLVVDRSSANEVALTWRDLEGEGSYSVERRVLGETSWTVIGTTSANQERFVDTSAAVGDYEYRVRSVAADGAAVSNTVIAPTPASRFFNGAYQARTVDVFSGNAADSEVAGLNPAGGITASIVADAGSVFGSEVYGLCADGGLHESGLVHGVDGPVGHFHNNMMGGRPVGEMVCYSKPSHPSNGAFFGVCASGGANGRGTIFRLTKSQGGSAELSLVASFTSALGERPAGGLAQGADGWLYGLMQGGGTHNAGTIYRVSPEGLLESVFEFNATNGRIPQDTLSLDPVTGDLFGVTLAGGSGDKGAVFKWSNGQMTTICEFATSRNGILAYHPQIAVTPVRGADGSLRLFGTLADGPHLIGESSSGVIRAGRSRMSTPLMVQTEHSPLPLSSLPPRADSMEPPASEGPTMQVCSIRSIRPHHRSTAVRSIMTTSPPWAANPSGNPVVP